MAATAAGVGSQGQMPAVSSSSSQNSASSKSVAVDASSSSTLTTLSPAAAAILKEAQAGSYISETLGGKIKGSSTSSTSAAAQQKPKLVVGPPQPGKAGPPTQLPSPQPDPRTKKAPADLPQAPLPPTASTPPNTATVQAQITAQQLQQSQKQLLKPTMRRNPTAPVFSEDGSLSWSWIEIEASILENGDEDSDGRPTSTFGTGF